MRTNAIATIYNKTIDSSTRREKYQRTIIGSVFWENKRAVNRAGSGQLEDDRATIFIPFALDANYLDPIAWRALSTKTGKWTLQSGDVIVKGSVTKEITEAVAGSVGPPVVPAVSAYTMTDLRDAYDDVLVITSVDVLDYGSEPMKHWQVGAK